MAACDVPLFVCNRPCVADPQAHVQWVSPINSLGLGGMEDVAGDLFGGALPTSGPAAAPDAASNYNIVSDFSI